MSIFELPDEILDIIFKYTDRISKDNLTITNSYFHKYIRKSQINKSNISRVYQCYKIIFAYEAETKTTYILNYYNEIIRSFLGPIKQVGYNRKTKKFLILTYNGFMKEIHKKEMPVLRTNIKNFVNYNTYLDFSGNLYKDNICIDTNVIDMYGNERELTWITENKIKRMDSLRAAQEQCVNFPLDNKPVSIYKNYLMDSQGLLWNYTFWNNIVKFKSKPHFEKLVFRDKIIFVREGIQPQPIGPFAYILIGENKIHYGYQVVNHSEEIELGTSCRKYYLDTNDILKYKLKHKFTDLLDKIKNLFN